MLKNMASSMEASLETEISSSQTSHPFYDHPKVHEMRSYGFGNEEQIKQSLLVYLDLLEAKRWWNVHVVPCSGLCQILVCGQPAQREPLEVVLPVRQDNELSVCHLQNLLTKVKAEHECTSLTLALMDSESSIVYYKISDGFIPPDPPESLQEKKKQRQRKFQHRKSRFIQASRNVDNARARYFGLGVNQVGASQTSPPGVSTATVNENEAGVDASKECGMTGSVFAPSAAVEHQQEPGPLKRRLDGAPEESQEACKHRKLDSQGQSCSNNIEGGLQGTQQDESDFLEPRPGPSYAMPAVAGDPDNRLFEPDAGHDSPKKEDEGVQVGVAMVHAPIMENDSDHDSGMDAGEDDEDEGFDEEL